MGPPNDKDRIAIGFKAHSGWAAAVTISYADGEYSVIDRRRIELTDRGEYWAKQPYHAAEELDPVSARHTVNRGITSAHRVARREVKKLFSHLTRLGGEVEAAAILVPSPMSDWNVDEILAVHPRMHKAEGVLFPDALCEAIDACGLTLVRIPEKQLAERAEEALNDSFVRIMEHVYKLGKSVGPPWGKDQKFSTVAAMITLVSA